MKKKKWLIVCMFFAVFLFGMSAQASGKCWISDKKVTLRKGQKDALAIYEYDGYGFGISVNGKKVKWKSSEKSVVTVSKTGVLKARKNGKATITAKYRGKTYRCKVSVKPMPVVDIGKSGFPFRGKIKKVTYKHPAGMKMTGYVLKLKQPVVVRNESGSMETAENIQVLLSDAQARKFKGKNVILQGDLFQPMTGYYLYTYAISPVSSIEKL